MSKPKVTFILTVDTEEEWDWSGPFPNDQFAIRNMQEIPAFQNSCQQVGIKPTYLVDYAVAQHPDGVSILKGLDQDQCEIGAHLHPWANPPFYDETTNFTSHVVNLPIEQVEQKLTALMAIIEANLEVKPVSFRTGRWGINGEVMKLLVKSGLAIDSSIYPLYRNTYFNCEHALQQPYWPDFKDTNQAGAQRDIVEIPVTAGFNRSASHLAQKLHRMMERPPFCWLRLNGFLWHSLLLRKLYLSPELCTTEDMIRLLKVCLKKRQNVIHMYLHSSSLIQGVTGLSHDTSAREKICKRIHGVVNFLQQHAEVEFCTLQQAKDKLIPESSK